MIGNKDSKSKFLHSFIAALVLHTAIFAFVKGDLQNIEFLKHLSEATRTLKSPIKLDQINIMKPEEVEKYRRVGIKNGAKNLSRPDLAANQQILRPRPEPKSPEAPTKGSSNLSLQNLAPNLPAPKPVSRTTTPPSQSPNILSKDFLNTKPDNSNGGHFYFNYKNQKVIPRSNEQEQLKLEATKNFTPPVNKATQNISNFEIRYERPEGVSEDELNSDEKAYYSFYVRSYQNYFSKIYATYEKIVIERPALARVFDKKHFLIGKIDYDENGNIVTVRILKSSEDDDLHYFFEETLKQLNQPNPPRVFTKNRKQFSIYYQLQIN